MTVPEPALARIKQFCHERTPPEFRDEMRLEATTRGNSVTLADRRPLPDDRAAEWMRLPFAQLRYQPANREWTLYWSDSNDRWHRYHDLDPTTDVDALIAEIDRDPTCIFFG